MPSSEVEPHFILQKVDWGPREAIVQVMNLDSGTVSLWVLYRADRIGKRQF